MENNNLDIVELIEKNPITRFSNEYQNRFIQKIKVHFNKYEQQLFITSFYCYLNYNSKTEYIIDLDNIWKWLGYSRKSDCKKVLIKHFSIKNNEFTLRESPQGQKDGRFSKEKVLMTVNTFKKLCLKSNTKKADEIHDYFIKMEEILNEIVDEESNELRAQLEEKETQLKIKDNESNNLKNQLQIKDKEYLVTIKLNKHNLLLNILKYKKCIYLAEVDENLVKIGSSQDIDFRKYDLKTVFGKLIFLDAFECEYFREIEQNILIKVNKFKYKKEINGHISKEVIKLTELFNYNQLVTIVKNEIKNYIKIQDIESKKLDIEREKFNTINKLIDNGFNFEQINKLINTNKINIFQENLLIKEEIQEEKLEIQENNLEIKNHNLNLIQKGQKIQVIDPDNLNIIVKVYNSMIHALRDQEHSYDKHSILKAINKNYIYKGYRWLFVKHGENHLIVKNILPTTLSKQPETCIIVQLNSDKTEIIETYTGITVLRKKYHIGDNKIYNIINENLLYDNTYLIKITDCPPELLNNYKKPLAVRKSSKSRAVKQINLVTKEEFNYKSICEATVKCGNTNLTITNAIKNKTQLNGFTWKYI